MAKNKIQKLYAKRNPRIREDALFRAGRFAFIIIGLVAFVAFLVHFLPRVTSALDTGDPALDAAVIGVPMLLVGLLVPLFLLKGLAGMSRALKHDGSHIDLKHFPDEEPRLHRASNRRKRG